MQERDAVLQQLLTALRTNILPALGDGHGARLLLAEPPVTPPPGIRILGYRPPLPQAPRLKPPSVHQCVWPRHGMDAVRYIGLGYVLEGEADFPLGTNIDRPSKLSVGADDARCRNGIQIVSIPERTLIVLPPGVPRPSGNRPHWERSDIARASSRIFWVLLLPSAAFCHICRTQGEWHGSDGVVTIEDDRLEPLGQLLVDEMRARASRFEAVVQSLALALMLRLERALNSPLVLPGRQLPLYPLPLPEASSLVRSICQYIQLHRSDHLTLEGIAHSHHLSPSQLNRRLRAEIGMSAIQYLTHCRIETAKVLLHNPEIGELPLRDIGSLVGFADVSYFRRVFTRYAGQSPTDYRQQRLAEPPALETPP